MKGWALQISYGFLCCSCSLLSVFADGTIWNHLGFGIKMDSTSEARQPSPKVAGSPKEKDHKTKSWRNSCAAFLHIFKDSSARRTFHTSTLPVCHSISSLNFRQESCQKVKCWISTRVMTETHFCLKRDAEHILKHVFFFPESWRQMWSLNILDAIWR